ncbi:hypothetical protein AB1N83_010893 [Pleurotus pulmonarius]
MPSPIPGRDGSDDGSFSSIASIASFATFSSESSDVVDKPPPPPPSLPLQPFPRRSFPVELLDNIFSHVTEYPDMRSILGVSRQFYALMLPNIWKHISIRPQIDEPLLSALAGQLDEPCSQWKTRGEQVQALKLVLALRNTKNPYRPRKDLREVYAPIHHILVKLANLRTLSFDISGMPSNTDVDWQRTDIDTRMRLPCLKTVAFGPAQIEIDVGDRAPYDFGCPTHPITPFDRWLLAQESIEHFEFRTYFPLVERFPANALPGLRRLKMTAQNIEVVRGMEGPRAITHLHMTVPMPCPFRFPEVPLPELPSGAPRLPPVLKNVTVLARGDGDFEFAGLLPKLERLDVLYEGRTLGHLLAALRSEDEFTHAPCSANLKGLRFLRACGLSLSPKKVEGEEYWRERGVVFSSIGGDGGTVADVFTELPSLEEFEAMRDKRTVIRYARDGSTRVVKWKSPCDPHIGESCEEWCQDWEGGVTSVDPESLTLDRPARRSRLLL